MNLFTFTVYAENCTHYPIGLSKYIDKKGIEITVSVAKTTLNHSIELAESEARINAKALLLKIPLFVSKDNKLIGVLDVLTCSEGEDVFAVVKISEQSIRQAQEIKSEIQESLKTSPTPISTDLQNATDFKSEFKRMLKIDSNSDHEH
jgi:hypothetical protein